jgi:hypothetical protein
MIARSQRIVSAVVVAAQWTTWMLWWSFPDGGTVHTAIFVVLGAFLGLFWYWLFGWSFGAFTRRRVNGAFHCARDCRFCGAAVARYAEAIFLPATPAAIISTT